ncbi:LOW QUALITY PROTEIN: hypothetical protein V1477_007585 [Vespula maculifrons]|uniref:Uncharacterized protein n=1 Tax=Vespula maculifrons TaxID=7453 RepID=A0ABD2CG94_VESMC
MRKSVPKCGDAWGCNFSVWRLEFVGSGGRPSRVTVSPRVSRSSNLHAVGPGSAVLVIYRFLSNQQVFPSEWLHISKFFQDYFHRIPTKFQSTCNLHSSCMFRIFCNKFLSGGSLGRGPWAWASVRVAFYGIWVGNDCDLSKSFVIQVLSSEWLHISKNFPKSFLSNSKLHFTWFLTSFVYSAIGVPSFLFIEAHSSIIIEFLSGGSHGMGPWAWASVRVSFLYRKIQLDFCTLVLVGFDVSSNGLFHIRLLDANTGKIERTFAPVSAGTGVVFPGAIKSPTIMDFLVGPQMQLPPRGGTWVGSTCETSKSMSKLYLKSITKLYMLGDRGTDHRGIFKRKHDRSCLEMSEADGVDSGAICKRGFIHLQFAEKPEAPEAERHLGSWILEIPVSPRISTCRKRFIAQGPSRDLDFYTESFYLWRRRISFLPFGQDRRTLAYVGWQRRWCSRARLSPKLALTYSTYSRECFRNARVSIVTAVDSILDSGVCRESTTGRAQVVIEASDVG